MFAKVFEQILDSSIASNYEVRHMFMDLLLLADAEGVVDMTYDAIARRLNVPNEKVVAYIGELMKPDPESRSAKNQGARLRPLDSHRSWGWIIVNYPHYRNLRDQESRRTYFRDKKRESRAKQAGVKDVKDPPAGQSDTARPTAADGDPVEKQIQSNGVKDNLNSERDDELGQSNPVNHVKPGQQESTNGEAEGEEKRPSAVSLTGRQTRVALIIRDRIKLKKLICQRILGGKNPDRMWSPDAENKLSTMAEEGVPLAEILDIAWFYSLPKNDEVPELRKRSVVLTETGLMQYWGDYAGRAGDYRKKINAASTDGAQAKPEPDSWREFFKWQYTPDIKLPASFWDLDPDQQKEYENGFQTFVNATRDQEARV